MWCHHVPRTHVNHCHYTIIIITVIATVFFANDDDDEDDTLDTHEQLEEVGWVHK